MNAGGWSAITSGAGPLTLAQGAGLVAGYALALLLAACLLPIALACLAVERMARRGVDGGE